MIKIQIPDIEELKSDYITAIQHPTLEELKLLKKALQHLQDATTIVSDDIVPVKKFTSGIVGLMRTPKLPAGSFNKGNGRYVTTLTGNYLDGATTIFPVQLNDLENLVDSLIDLTTGNLVALLIGAPETLKDTSEAILAEFNIVNEQDQDVLKLAFDYTEGDIGKMIRSFFYGKDLTTFCPYCNQGLALHTENILTGYTADQFQLDHFFDKAKNPLLAFSLFNLVPSDSTCNAINKLSKPFDDGFHLNPYIAGFKRDFLFKPIFDELTLTISSIEFDIKTDRHSDRYFQLIGNEDSHSLNPAHGNLNVFEIYTKYNSPHVFDKTSLILRGLYRNAINKRSLADLLDETELLDDYENFKDWYEHTVYTKFHQKEFGLLAHSKLNRDMIDHLYDLFPHDETRPIREILVQSYLPEKGGE